MLIYLVQGLRVTLYLKHEMIILWLPLLFNRGSQKQQKNFRICILSRLKSDVLVHMDNLHMC